MYARLIRWAFERFYREFAWTYDTVAALVSAGHWRDWALAVQPHLRGAVLELGCGTGNLQRALAGARPPARAVGLDASPSMLALTRRKLARAGLAAPLVLAEAGRLPFGDASFDSLAATFPSQYIVAPETLAEARRVLRPGGRLAIVLGAQLDGDSLYRRLVDLAYMITLQRTPQRSAPAAPAQAQPTPAGFDPFLARLSQSLAQAGFTAQHRWVAAPGGAVYLILAEVAA